MTAPIQLHGFPRQGGGVGARNHVLVLPTVVCAGMAAAAIAGDDAVAIVHQHGCDHVGVDAVQAGRVLVGMAANPNVAGTVLLGLGCETMQGRPLQGELLSLDREVRYLEIQGCGGSAGAVEAGRAEAAALIARAAGISRAPSSIADLMLGLATGASVPIALVEAIADRVRSTGASLIVAIPHPVADLSPRLSGALVVGYGCAAPHGLAVTIGATSLSEQHTALAASGAQVLISISSPGRAPTGSPICPVVSVASDPETYAALRDDFDIDASDRPPVVVADEVVRRAIDAFNGDPTAAERRGAREFALQRLIRST